MRTVIPANEPAQARVQGEGAPWTIARPGGTLGAVNFHNHIFILSFSRQIIDYTVISRRHECLIIVP